MMEKLTNDTFSKDRTTNFRHKICDFVLFIVGLEKNRLPRQRTGLLTTYLASLIVLSM